MSTQQMRLNAVHFSLLDAMYLAGSDGVPQGTLEKMVLTELHLPCLMELHELCHNVGVGAGTAATRVMRRDSPDEPVVPHRYAMTEGRDGLRENYATLCRMYQRALPAAAEIEKPAAPARPESIIKANVPTVSVEPPATDPTAEQPPALVGTPAGPTAGYDDAGMPVDKPASAATRRVQALQERTGR